MAIYETEENGIRRALTDDEVVQQLAHHIIFTPSRTQVSADGVTVVTVGVQLMSLPLSDGTRRPIQESRAAITLLVDGDQEEISLDANGHAELAYAFDAPGEYTINTDGAIYSDGIVITAV